MGAMGAFHKGHGGGGEKCEQRGDAQRENSVEGAITGQKAKGAWKIANVLLSRRTRKALPANFGSLLFSLLLLTLKGGITEDGK